MKKFNQKFLKSQNQGLILKTLRENGPMPRSQISKEIGIVRSTVSEITNELVGLNIVTEGKKVEGNLGKRPTLLYFNKEYYFFISVAITRLDATIAVCNLNGEIAQEKVISFWESITAKEILDEVFETIDRIILESGKEKFCLISVGSPETFNIRTGKIKWAPYIKDWLGLDLKAMFFERYQTDIILKDHMKLETMGEHWKSFGDVSNMVYIIITNGIGSGAIIDGKIREGKNGYLGEIAFLPVSVDLEYEGLRRNKEDLGYFESRCDINSILTCVRKYLKDNDRKPLVQDMKDVAKLYKTDQNVRDLIHAGVMKTIALGIAAVTIVLDPEIIVINGEILELGDAFLDFLKKEINHIIPYRRRVVFSKLRDKAYIYGAIRNGLDHIERMLYQNPEHFYRLSNSPVIEG